LLAHKLAPNLAQHGRFVEHDVRTLTAVQVVIGASLLIVRPHVELPVHWSGTLIIDQLRFQDDLDRYAVQVGVRYLFVRPAVFPKTGATEVLKKEPAHPILSGRELPPKPLK
jgi:hypothetical protein